MILPAIFAQYRRKIRVYIHPDACHGKSCVDDHCAVSHRLLKRNISETHYDVLNPEDIVDPRIDALPLVIDGVKNSVVDFISIDREYVDLDKYEIASEKKLIAHLETPCENRYEEVPDTTGKFTATVYK